MLVWVLCFRMMVVWFWRGLRLLIVRKDWVSHFFGLHVVKVVKVVRVLVVLLPWYNGLALSCYEVLFLIFGDDRVTHPLRMHIVESWKIVILLVLFMMVLVILGLILLALSIIYLLLRFRLLNTVVVVLYLDIGCDDWLSVVGNVSI